MSISSKDIFDGIPVGLVAKCDQFLYAKIICNGQSQICTDLNDLFLVPKFGLNNIKLITYGLGSKDVADLHVWANKIQVKTNKVDNSLFGDAPSFLNSRLNYSGNNIIDFKNEKVSFRRPEIKIPSIQFNHQFEYSEQSNKQ